MTNKQKRMLLYIILTFVMLAVTVFGGQVTLSAFAATDSYTNVLTDLLIDENFNVEDYPENKNLQSPKDYLIQVIQVAESTGGELFLYTYQPCQNVKPLSATQINMSLTDKMGGSFEVLEDLLPADMPCLYKLTLLNSRSVFCKYRVDGFLVGSEEERCYNISTIYRDFIEGIDNPSGTDNTINGIAYPVGRIWTVSNTGEDINCIDVDVLEIKDAWAGFTRYLEDRFWLGKNLFDCHFVAFSTDWDIDTVYSASVSYDYQPLKFTQIYVSGTTELSPPFVQTFTENNGVGGSEVTHFKSTDLVTVENGQHSFYRIQSVDDFLKSEGDDMSAEGKQNLNGMQWVLRFAETPFNVSSNGFGKTVTEYTGISKVSILRLQFRSQGKFYNLGVVDNQRTADDIPDNPNRPVPDNTNIGFWAYIWQCIVRLFNGTATLVEQIVAVVAIFIVVLALPIFLTVLSFVFPVFGAGVKTVLKGVWTGIKYLFIGLWYVISSPIRLIIWIVHKKRGD